MSETATAAQAKLPLWRTVRESYAWGLGHLGTVVNKAWLVLVVLAVVSFVLHWLAHPYVASPGTVLGQVIPFGVVPLAVIVFGAMIAVPWHRFVLNDEPLPSISPSATPRVLSYIGWGIAMSAPFYAVLLAVSILPESPAGEEEGGTGYLGLFFVGLLIFLFACYVLVRLSIKLVAVALGDDTATLGAVWRATAWNFWWLFWGTVLTLLPVLAVGIGLAYLVPDQDSQRWLYAIGNMLYSIAEVLLGMVSLTFLSLAYRHFFRAA